MKLFLLRHAMTARAESDELRRITPDGTRALKDVVSRRLDELANIKAILSSPFERVKQTARVAAEVIGYEDEIIDNTSLNKLTMGEEIIESLKQFDHQGGDLLLVSHESSLCNLMLCLANEDILMANSSLTAIETVEIAYGHGKLLWQESPNSSEIKRSSNFADMF
jgi:phosphohistidine phosphatase SixA